MKICSKCASSDFYKCGKCKNCAKSQNAKWHSANKEKSKENSAKWKSDNLSQYIQNKINYRVQNREKAKITAKTWRDENPERAKANVRAWSLANYQDVLLKNQNYRAKRRKSEGTLSRGLCKKLLASQNGKCTCCGLPLGDKYHMDHIIPLSIGGLHVDQNIQLLHPTCNLKKGSKHPIDFMQELGMLL